MAALVTENGPSADMTPAQLEASSGVPARVFESIRAGIADWMILQHLDAAAGALGTTRARLKASFRGAHSRVWGRRPSTANNKPALFGSYLLPNQPEGTNL